MNAVSYETDVTRPRAIDLFSGGGGLTLGLRKAGFNVLAAVEIDDLAVETYRANHRSVAIFVRDIRRVTGSELLERCKLAPGDLELLAGCPPCQGFSAMRSRNGGHRIRDGRNDLIYEFLRLARVLRPKAIMMENVPGLEKNQRFAEFRRELKRLGYTVNSAVKDASRYGVPQRRKRLILVAGRGFEIPFAEESESGPSVRDAIGGLPPAGQSGDPAHDVPERRSSEVQRKISQIPKDGGSRSDLPLRDQLACHRKSNGFSDVYGRMAWDKVAPTITSGCYNPSKGRFLHPEANRAITLREAALLQGFPSRYRFPDCTRKEALALLIGNALPPEFIRRHALEIRRALKTMG